MIRSYLNIAIRNFRKNSLSILVNIFGLAIAMAICITTYISCKYNWDWDSSHKNGNDIYKVNITRDVKGNQQEYAISPIALAKYLKNDLPDIKNVVRYESSLSTLQIETNYFSKSVGFVDDNFLDVFDFPLIESNNQKLKEKGGILITEKLAKVCFGDKDPIGKVIVLIENEKKLPFVVRGVIKDIPLNSSFNFEALICFNDFIDIWNIDETNWRYFTTATFIHVKDAKQISMITNQLSNYISPQNKANEAWKVSGYNLDSFKNIAKRGRIQRSNNLKVSFSQAAVIVPIVMSIFILLISCFNFINTSISNLDQRLKEIAIRKVLGSHRKGIIIQLLIENLTICIIALFVGLFFAYCLLPLYESLVVEGSVNFELSLKENIPLWIFLALLVLSTSMIAGIFPVLRVSKFSPINVFKKKLKLSSQKVISSLLLVIQFVLSIISIIIGIIFTQNAYYQEKFNIGYNDKNLIIINISKSSDLNLLRNNLNNNVDIISTSEARNHIGYGEPLRNFSFLEKKQEVVLFEVGYDYLQTIGLNLIDGRMFYNSLQSSDYIENSIVVNEKFVNDYALKEPIGKMVYMNDTVSMTIIGVVKNIYHNGTMSILKPTAFKLVGENNMRFFIVRTSENKSVKINSLIKDIWSKIEPEVIYTSDYQENIMIKQKILNSSLIKMFIFLAFITLTLSLIGLYAQVSLNCIRRTKEIGIRTIFGASVIDIIRVVSQKFLILLAISAILGCTFGYFMGISIIRNIFTYFTEVNLNIFILSVLIVFSSVVLSISRKVYKTANKNPVDSIRYE